MPRFAASLLAALATFATPAGAQQAGFEEIVAHIEGGLDALGTGDTAAYLAGTGRAYALAPAVPAVAYHRARAFVLAGRPDSALTLLQRLAGQGAVVTFEAAEDSAFAGLAADPGFKASLVAIERAKAPVARSAVAHELPERDLIAEGVAYDSRSGTLFISSLYKRKIVAIARDGSTRDFVATGAEDLGPVVGMEVDSRRRTLWAAAMYLPEGGIPFPDSTLLAHGVLFKYDVDSGKLIKRYVVPPGAVRHGFNDVTVLPNGDAYVTDSQGGGIFAVRGARDTLVEVVPPGTDLFPNGITHSNDGRWLFVGHGGGLEQLLLHRQLPAPGVPGRQDPALGRAEAGRDPQGGPLNYLPSLEGAALSSGQVPPNAR
jgi:hypothetical protein